MENKIENYQSARKFMIETLHEPITEDYIKSINGRVMNGTNEPSEYDMSGQARITDQTGKIIYEGPNPIYILIIITNFISWHESNCKNNLEPIKIATNFYWGLVKIHPFFDGNGRTALILLIKILLNYGYTKAECNKLEEIFENKKLDVYDALKNKCSYYDYNDDPYGFKYTSTKFFEFMDNCNKKLKQI